MWPNYPSSFIGAAEGVPLTLSVGGEQGHRSNFTASFIGAAEGVPLTLSVGGEQGHRSTTILGVPVPKTFPVGGEQFQQDSDWSS